MYFCKMKIEITLISMVLVFSGCYCAVNSNNTVIVRATSTTSTTNTTSDNSDENPVRNVLQCFKADALFKCFNDRVGVLIKVWREALINSVRRNGDQPLVVNHSFEGVIRDLGNAVYYGFTSFFYNTSSDAEEARLLAEETNTSDQTKDLERGHHKKKKVHKEIKKLVIKVIVAIFLVMQKIKWALLMIQTILLNNFILVATLFVLSKTIKVWHELKHKQHHVEKQVVVYDNVHHQHYDKEGEHSEYEEGHGHNHGWGWWGRSLQAQTEPTTVSEQDYGDNEYYTNRVIRSIGKGRKRRGTS